MVSCLLTRVILNVSVALTIQCYQPDGSVYNRTICAMMPSNLAKIELLRDLFRQHNMTIPDNLFGQSKTSMDILLGQNNRSVVDNFFRHQNMSILDNLFGQNNISAVENLLPQNNLSTGDNLVTTGFHSIQFNSTPVELLEPIGDKDDVYVDSENGKVRLRSRQGSTVLTVSMADKSNEHKENKTKLESDQKELEDESEVTENTRAQGTESPNSTKYLSLHDQIAISLERQMNMIEANETAYKAERAKELLDESEGVTSQEHDANTTHNAVHDVTAMFNMYESKNVSLSEESGDNHNTAKTMKEIGVTRDSTFNITQDVVTINTNDEINKSEKKKEDEEEKISEVSLGEKEIDNSMRQARHLESVELITKLHEQTNRIEKRSIPITNSGSYESQHRKTTNNLKENETTCLERSKSSEKQFKLFFPGPNNFWDVFVTSPVAVILNSTSLYEKYDMLGKTDYEEQDYDNLEKSVKEKHETWSQAQHTNDEQTEPTKLYSENKPENTYFNSEELTEMLGNLANHTSDEKILAKNLLKKMKKKPATRPLKERLSPEKYAEYLELKRSLDDQYKDIQRHMNKTDNDLKKLFIEMRHLKEEKELQDYYEENENQFTHHSTPKNYTDEIIIVTGPTEPTVNQWEWENASQIIPEGVELTPKDIREDDMDSDMRNYQMLDAMDSFILRTEPEEEDSEERDLGTLFSTTPTKINIEYHVTQRKEENLNYESLERYDKKKYEEIREMEAKQDKRVPNISKVHLDYIHSKFMSHFNKTKTGGTRKISVKTTTVTEKLWFEESVFDPNDPKILYAKYLHNVRNMTVKLNMEVGNKQIQNITSFNIEDRRYAHQYKTTTECRRFSHIIPFWLTQPKEIEDVFKGNTKIFREYIQYILDKHNFTELPVVGQFAFLRRYINKLNNPLIFNRITIFPTAYATTDHVLTLKDQFKQFKGSLKSKIHKAYKHVKHFFFNSSIDEIHDPVPVVHTEAIPDEVIINITTAPPMGPYYDYY